MKYTANDIARILEASNVIDSLREPTAEEIYNKAKEIISLLEQILPRDIGWAVEDRIAVARNLYLYKSLYKADRKNGHKYCFTFSLRTEQKWDGTRYEEIDAKPNFEDDGPDKNNWLQLLQNRDSVIEQAITIRQKYNACKIARIQCVK